MSIMQKGALLSVTDKTGLLDFAKILAEKGFTMLATKGTGNFLSEHGLSFVSLEEYTNQKEILGGRVKTLHPKVYAGILARRDNQDDMQELKAMGALSIDIVVVNLYPFIQNLKKDLDLNHMIELIDVGGPSMIRAAAKNFKSVWPIMDTQDLTRVAKLLESEVGKEDEGLILRQDLAAKVFANISRDSLEIASYLSKGSQVSSVAHTSPDSLLSSFPPIGGMVLKKTQELRYGENPHQKAAFYLPYHSEGKSWDRLGGKELSYNNILDVDAAIALLAQIKNSMPTAVIIKHLNCCGGARAKSLLEALQLAKKGDPRSHFGGVIGFTQSVTEEVARALREDFAEIVIAPDFEEKAQEVLRSSKSLRIIKVPLERNNVSLLARSALGGVLLQEEDSHVAEILDAQVVSKRQVIREELDNLDFSWKVCAHVKSNAVVIVRDLMVVGVGAGQMSRVDAAELAVHKAKFHGHSLKNAVAASDAFFPFSDGLEILAREGIKAVIAPSGAKRDEEVVEMADKYGISLLFAKERHFRH